MVSSVLASLLKSYLGQYLELSDASISAGSEVRLENVRLKESAFSDLGLPVKIVHGKVKRLVMKIPWFSLFTKSTTLELDGLHLLVVPSSSVAYDEEAEIRLASDAKQRRLERAEEAKNLYDTELRVQDTENVKEQDSFVQRLAANIIKNLEVTIRRVHIRYEDNQDSIGRYAFAAGVTLDKLLLNTTAAFGDISGKEKFKVFEKKVVLNGFAVYWRPKANLYSSEIFGKEDVVDIMFDSNIGTKNVPVEKLKYLLGPINSNARLVWCLNPESHNFKIPEVDLFIKMEELALSLTKYQYQNFLTLLESFEFMSRAEAFRKYKARNGLENLPNYHGKSKNLWKFAFDCVYEEEVTRRINNWSWSHMTDHLAKCKEYRSLYRVKLLTKKPDKALRQKLRKLEDQLDEVNICVQRQLAEREIERKEREKIEKKSSAGGWWGWWSGKSSTEDDENEVQARKAGEFASTVKKLEEALTPEEKDKLYEAIDYQESASLSTSIYPKGFVAHILKFQLDNLLINIRDDDLPYTRSSVLALDLANVSCNITQRPKANNLMFRMSMEKLTVNGFKGDRSLSPNIVATVDEGSRSNLLSVSFEHNPPNNPNGDLNKDKGSVYENRIQIESSPLELSYDTQTFSNLRTIFATSKDEMQLASLQQNATAKLNELKASTTLGLQYAIDHHSLVDVAIILRSCHVIVPHGGDATSRSSAVAVASLGSIQIKSKPVSTEMRNIKEMSFADLQAAFDEANLYEKIYDKFNVSLENLQMLVALPNEPWRMHLHSKASPLFLLKPTTIAVLLQYCFVRRSDIPLYKVDGSLGEISISIADYRLIKLAQILDSLFEKPVANPGDLVKSDSNESMHSALSSLANTGSLIQTSMPAPVMTSVSRLVQLERQDSLDSKFAQLTQLAGNFGIGIVNLTISQVSSSSSHDQEVFDLKIENLKANATIKTYETNADFEIGGIRCKHLLAKDPGSTSPGIDIVYTGTGQKEDFLLSMKYFDVKDNSEDFDSLYNSTRKHLQMKFTKAQINVHQDALSDLVDKAKKLVDELSKKAKNLMAAEDAQATGTPDSPKIRPNSFFKFQDQNMLSRHNVKKMPRGISMKSASTMARWAARAKMRSRSSSLISEVIDFKITASLESVSFSFLTSKIRLANVTVQDLGVIYSQTKSLKEIEAKLLNFEIKDAVDSGQTFYQMIAESQDQKVFDATIVMYENVDAAKQSNPSVVDVKVDAVMGRIKMVFLMKFVNDFLTFLEPFQGAKEIVAERANDALEGATKRMMDAYTNSTRVALNIHMEAPLIIIPVHSKSRMTFMGDLGTLYLNNRFTTDTDLPGKIFDEMNFCLKDLKLMRAKIREDADTNEILYQCQIVKPITFELKMVRNMAGSYSKVDPPEISLTGTLYQIKMEMSQGDYNAMLSLITENFNEKGQFDNVPAGKPTLSRDSLGLPLPSRHKSGSRSSLVSERSFKEALSAKESGTERKIDTRIVEFNLKFRGLEAEIFRNETSLEGDLKEVRRDLNSSLAKFSIKLLSVEGNMFADSSLEAQSFLENLVLEDTRNHIPSSSTFDDSSSLKSQLTSSDSTSHSSRIVKLMEAKQGLSSGSKNRMIEVHYKKDAKRNQEIEVRFDSPFYKVK